MAYSSVWDETVPLGTVAANTIDDLFRALKRDLREREADYLALPSASAASYAADPLRAYGLKFTDAQDAVISLGDNAGTARNLSIKNKAGSTIYFTFGQTSLDIVGALNLTINTNKFTVAGATGNTVIAGTLGVTGAGTFSTGIFSGLVTITSSQVLQGSGQTTARQFIDFTNTGGRFQLGVDSSAGGGMFTGTSAYSSSFGTVGATSLHFATNNIVRATIDSAGAASFGSIAMGALTATTAVFSTGATSNILISRISDNTTYQCISLNNVVTQAGIVGMYYKDTGLGTFYFNVASGNNISFSVNNVETALFSPLLTRMYLVAEGSTQNAVCTSGTGAASSQIYVNNGVSTCLVSSERFKNGITPVETVDALGMIQKMVGRSGAVFYTEKENGRPAFGLISERMAEIDYRLAAFGSDGQANGTNYEQVTTLLVPVVNHILSTLDAFNARLNSLNAQLPS